MKLGILLKILQFIGENGYILLMVRPMKALTLSIKKLNGSFERRISIRKEKMATHSMIRS